MKNFLRMLLSAAVLAVFGATPTQAQTYQLVWADEFRGGLSPDWQFETGGNGWGNNEQQYYQAANATVVNDNLVITARRENVGGRPYTSARMITKGRKEFKYGKIEARMKLPLGQGLWPAFWMLGGNISTVGWPACGEIDVMEHINSENKIYGTPHWDSNGGRAQYSGSTITTPQDFHVYTVEWDASNIRWFVDGQQYHIMSILNNVGSTEEFHRPFFLLLNLAVAGDWPGQVVDESKLPAAMYVDYVRVYQKTNAPAPFSRQIQAEAYSAMNGVQLEATSDAGGGQNVGYIDAGDWMAYNAVNFPTSGSYTIEYRVASPGGSRLSADLNAGATQLGTVNIPATGGWQNWTTVSQTVNVAAGTYNFGIYAQAGGWNINWLRITKQGSARMAQATTDEPQAISVKKLALYPNPASSQLMLSGMPEAGGAVSILNMQGRQVWSGTYSDSGKALDVSGLPPGLYTLVVIGTDDQRKQTIRFSKE